MVVLHQSQFWWQNPLCKMLTDEQNSIGNDWPWWVDHVGITVDLLIFNFWLIYLGLAHSARNMTYFNETFTSRIATKRYKQDKHNKQNVFLYKQDIYEYGKLTPYLDKILYNGKSTWEIPSERELFRHWQDIIAWNVTDAYVNLIINHEWNATYSS